MLYRCSVFHSSVLLLYINNYVTGRGRVHTWSQCPSPILLLRMGGRGEVKCEVDGQMVGGRGCFFLHSATMYNILIVV